MERWHKSNSKLPQIDLDDINVYNPFIKIHERP